MTAEENKHTLGSGFQRCISNKSGLVTQLALMGPG